MSLEIHLENAGKSYYRQWLFRAVNQRWIAKPGQSLALLGPNGSGKSTLALMIAGQVEPSEGSCTWRGDNQQSLQAPLGYIALSSPALELPEEWTLNEWFNFQNELVPFRKGCDAERFLHDCGYSKKLLLKPISTYSSGMKQRVKLVLALWADVSLSIVDEPCTNLDKTGEDLYVSWVQECLQHQAVLVASNRLEEYSFCQEKWALDPHVQQLRVE